MWSGGRYISGDRILRGRSFPFSLRIGYGWNCLEIGCVVEDLAEPFTDQGTGTK